MLAKVTSVSISLTVTDTRARHSQTYTSLAAVPALVGVMMFSARSRRSGDRTDDESGFALIYVMMIITIITVLVGSSLVITASNVVPAAETAYKQAADAAAQGGLQAFLARLDANCSNSARATVQTCYSAGVIGSSGSGTIYSSSGYSSTYTWTARPTDGNTYYRVTATGTVASGAITQSRTLTADLAGGASTSCLDYSVCTQYETQAPDVMAQQYPGRTIQLSSTARAAANAVSGTGGNSVTWTGPSTADAGGSVRTCNATYLGATGRRNYQPTGSNGFVDWSESGSLNGTAVTDLQPCQVSLGSSTKLLAPASTADGSGGYYSRDALLVSNSNPGGTGGPLLNQPVYTGYQGSDDPGGVAGQNYRSFTLTGFDPQIGGTPDAASTYPNPNYVSSGPIGISASPTIGSTGACVYTGPTRVKLNSDGTATITSPLTTAKATGSPTGCYPTSVTGGIYGFTTVALTSLTGFSGIFSVANSGTAPGGGSCGQQQTGWQLTCLKKYKDANGSSSSSLTTAVRSEHRLLQGLRARCRQRRPEPVDRAVHLHERLLGDVQLDLRVDRRLQHHSTATAAARTAGRATRPARVAAARSPRQTGWRSSATSTAARSAPRTTTTASFATASAIDLARSTCLSGTVTSQQSCVQAFLTSELNPPTPPRTATSSPRRHRCRRPAPRRCRRTPRR